MRKSMLLNKNSRCISKLIKKDKLLSMNMNEYAEHNGFYEKKKT